MFFEPEPLALIITQSKTHVPQIKANKMGMWRTGSHLAGSVCDALGKAKGHKLATCRGPECSAECSAVQRSVQPREAFGSYLGTHHVSVSTRLRSVVDTLGSGLAYILHLSE